MNQNSENKIMSQCEVKLNVQLQNSVFKISKENAPDIYYIPVYPRAYLEEIVTIDTDRRTVTAKFIIMITVSLMNLAEQQSKLSNRERINEITRQKEIKQFVRNHLIIEFGYNQTIYIPQHITLENTSYLINKVMNIHSHDKYVTYRIKGQIQCNAYFDLMFFPYRKIQVQNNLCLRSQTFQCKDGKQVIIKYNIMMLMQQQNKKYKQFIPYSLREKFGPYQLQWKEEATISSQKLLNTIVNADVITTIKNVMSYVAKKQNKKEQGIQNNVQQVQLHPYKHMVFKFEMTSMKIPFLMQQEIPIWVITIITLFLFHSQPSIGNKYSCIILLLISFIAVITDFRLSNTSQPVLTFFQLKLISLLIVPILLIISTQLDYYKMQNFTSRSNQLYNPFFIASVIISLICFILTYGALIVLSIKESIQNNERKKLKTNKAEEMIDWMNMIELKWGNPKLKKKLLSLCTNKTQSLKFLQPQMEKSMIDSILHFHSQTSILQPPLMINSRKNNNSIQEQSFYN